VSELLDFVEAPGRLMEPSEGTLVVETPRFVLVGSTDGVWASVQGIRLRDGEASGAVAEVRDLLPPVGARVVSWWLSERATPAGVEDQLLEAGLEIVAHDYRLDALVATAPPPPGPREIEVRPAATAADWADIRELQEDVFDNAAERRPTRRQLLAEFGRTGTVLFGAWLDGELVASAGATPSSRGMLLWDAWCGPTPADAAAIERSSERAGTRPSVAARRP
jgi:hypothetical protein